MGSAWKSEAEVVFSSQHTPVVVPLSSPVCYNLATNKVSSGSILSPKDGFVNTLKIGSLTATSLISPNIRPFSRLNAHSHSDTITKDFDS